MWRTSCCCLSLPLISTRLAVSCIICHVLQSRSYPPCFSRKAYVDHAFSTAAERNPYFCHQDLRGQRPVPISLWITSEEFSGRRPDSIWAVFRTHEEVGCIIQLGLQESRVLGRIRAPDQILRPRS